MAQRVTNNNSRKGDNGKVIKAKHNEHEHAAEHIDETKTADNVRMLFQDVAVEEGKDFQDRYEQAVYEAYFSDYLEARNQKALEGRHKERVQTMEQFRGNLKACPEETLYYIGNKDDNVDPETLRKVYEAYHKWHEETFPNVMLLSAYMHVDEATPHIHERKVWTAHEGDMLIINQNKALEEMGIERPDLTKKTNSRFNNAKMTYTEMCREKLKELAREYGLEIIDEPREASKSGKKLLQYQYDKLKEENEALTAKNAALEQRVQELEHALTEATADVKATKTVKGVFGKEKEVPKTADELERDKTIVGAKLVLQREGAVQKREQSVETDRQLLAATVNNAVALERQEGDERQRRAVARARKEEQEKATQSQAQLQKDRDRAVKELAEERSRSEYYKELATDYAYLVNDLDLPDSYKDYAEQLWQQLEPTDEIDLTQKDYPSR